MEVKIIISHRDYVVDVTMTPESYTVMGDDQVITGSPTVEEVATRAFTMAMSAVKQQETP